jgi:alkanesulfonate monooxygenase
MPILIGGYVDKVLQRASTAGDGWLTYFYRPEDFTKSWNKIRNFAKDAGKDPDALLNASQLPILVGASKQAVQDDMMDWLNKEWDFPAHSDCKRESAIIGSVDECVAQLREHLAVGVQKIIFVPYKYRPDQVEIIAREIIPRLKAS